MGDYRSIVDILADHGAFDDLPDGLDPAVKFVNPDWTTYGGFSWWQPGKRWIQSPDNHFDPETCTDGGLHVANNVRAAQSGGARVSHCLVVGVKPSESGVWDEGGKRKARRVYVLGPVDLVGVLRRDGAGADLTRANLTGANLYRANLSRANLTRADLNEADLYRAYLTRATLTRADLYGANLYRADLSGADLTGANLYRANLTGADLTVADLTGADLSRADLTGADLTVADLTGADLTRADLTGANLTGADLYGHNKDALKQRGAIL